MSAAQKDKVVFPTPNLSDVIEVASKDEEEENSIQGRLKTYENLIGRCKVTVNL